MTRKSLFCAILYHYTSPADRRQQQSRCLQVQTTVSDHIPAMSVAEVYMKKLSRFSQCRIVSDCHIIFTANQCLRYFFIRFYALFASCDSFQFRLISPDSCPRFLIFVPLISMKEYCRDNIAFAKMRASSQNRSHIIWQIHNSACR